MAYTYTGTDGSDTITASMRDSMIRALGGRDVIIIGNGYGKSSDATIDAGGGNDTIFNRIDGYVNGEYFYKYSFDRISVNGGEGNDLIYNGYTYNYDINVSVSSDINKGNYATLEGGAGNDSIWNCSDNVKIDGGNGDDSVATNGEYSITITGGNGNDTICNANENADVLYKYADGDGNDIITGFNDISTLQIGGGTGTYYKETVGKDIIVTVGEGNITLVGAASLSEVYIDGTEVEKPIWRLNGNIATYGNSTETLVTINGVKSLDGISLSGSTVTIANSSLNQSPVSISDGYSLALANDVTLSSTTPAGWNISGLTATYKNASTSAGYQVINNQIFYTQASYGEDLITVNGVISTGGLTFDGNKTVTVSSSALYRTTVTINNGYNLALGSDVTKATTTAGSWASNGTTATYTKPFTSAGYSIVDNQIVYNSTSSGGETFTVSGIASTNGLTFDGDKTVTIANSALNQSTVTVSDGYILKLANDVTISSTTAGSWASNGTTATYTKPFTSAGYSIVNNQIVYNFASGGETFTVSGVTSTNGLTFDGDKTVTVANSALNLSTVSISDGYTLKLANDVPTPSSVAAYWKIENGTAKYIEGAITAGYKLNGNQIVHDDEVDGEIKVELDGIASAPAFADNDKTIIRLTADNVEGDITLLGNAGGYKFKIEGENVVFNGGEGDDSVNASNASVLYKYSEGDGNDFIQGFNSMSTLQIGGGTGTYRKETVDADIILTVGEGKITLEGAAALENLNVSGDQIKDAISNSYSNSVVNGTSDGDTISNTGNNVTINAGAGDDTITNYGTAPSITAFSAGHYVLILADDGNDSIENSGANSVIDGGNDNDTIDNDSYAIGSSVLGGTGNDSISNSGEGTKVYGGDGSDTINNTNLAAKASLFGNNGGDFISTYNADSVSIDGGADNDIIDVRGAAQGVSITGGLGNDSIKLSGGNNLVQYTAGDGSDTVYGFTTKDSLQIGGGTGIYSTIKSGENIIVTTSDGKITLTGAASLTAVNIQGELFNLINNTVSNTVVNGTSEKDSIYNSSSNLNVTINGGEGSDTVYNYGSNAVINGGEGNDTVYNGHYNGDSVLINGEGDNDFLQTRGVYTTIYGGNGNDTLAGRYLSGSILADGGAGNDSIVNFGNNSTLLGDADDDTIVNYTEAFYDNETYKDVGKKVSIDGGAGNDFIRNFANQVTIRGGEGNDTIQNPRWYGAAENVFVDAGAGNDTVSNSGNNNTLFGGAGDDTIWNTGVSIRDGATIDSGVGNKVSISGGDGNDLIRNNNGTSDVTINGGKGNDTIENTDANVLIKYQAGDGNDLITGFNETSTLSISGAPYTSTKSGDDLILTVGDSNGIITLSGAASLSSVNIAGTFVESITSNRISDFKLNGTDNADAIYNRGARVTIDAGNGNDTINNYGLNPTIANPSVGGYVSINAGEGNDSVYNSGRYTLIDGGNGNDTLTNSNWGLSATFRGGAGNDFISTYNDNSVSMDGGEGDDTLDARGTALGVSITGGKGNDSIKLNGGNNLVQYTAGDGNDSVYGLRTTDSLQIGGGTGIYSTIKSGENIIVTTADGSIILSNAASLESVNIVGEFFNPVDNSVLNTVVNGTSGKDLIFNSAATVTINGDDDGDYIHNTGAHATIYGGAGDDTVALASDTNYNLIVFRADDGNDLIQGFNETSTLQIGNGNDSYTSTKSGEDILVTVGSGKITIKGAASLESVNINGEFINAINNTASNTIVNGTSNNDSIYNTGTNVSISGGTGNDYIYNDRGTSVLMNGGTNNDTLYNYKGNLVTINADNGDDEAHSYEGDSVLINLGDGNDYSNAFLSKNITVFGDGGNDTIKGNKAEKIFFNGGGGNDYFSIHNDTKNVTVSGNTGNDTISLTDDVSNILIQYAAGDGNDYISGFNETSTLLIGGGTYSTVKSGDDIFVTIGDGSILLRGAATLESVNIISSDPAWTLDGTTATYGTYLETLITVSGVTSASGLTFDGDKTVTVAAASLDTLNVSISGGYSLALGEDVATPTTLSVDWIINGTTASYQTGTRNAGYSLVNNQIIYTPSGDKVTLAELDGVDKDKAPVVENDKIKLAETNFADKEIAVVNNDGKFAFEFAAEDYGEVTFVGSEEKDTVTNNGSYITFDLGAGKDSIVNNGNDVSISGGDANDKINNSGSSVSISGGAGNDIITLNGGTGGNIFVYANGDGKDNLYSFKANDTIKIIDAAQITANLKGSDVVFNVGSGSITIKDGTKLNSTIKVVDTNDKDITSISRNEYTTDGIISNEQGGEKKIILVENLAEYVVNKVNIIDGSQNKSGVKIDGSGVEEISLIGGSGKDTLISGTNSEFKLTGGKGNDVFVFKGGNGSISDYSQKGSNGKDKIDIGDGLNFDDYEIDGGNVILTYKDGDNKSQKLTIEGGEGKDITIRTKKDNKTDTAINRYEMTGIFDSSGKSVSLASGTENFIATKTYSKIITIDGSLASEVEIIGNKKANVIIAGKGNSTLDGGKGADTLVGGIGDDIFVYNANSGNKIIQDFGEDDKISLDSGVNLSEVQVKGDDLVLKVGSNKITIAGGKGNPFTFIEDGEEKTYSNGLLISADKNSASLTSSFADKEFDLSNYDYKNVSAGLIKKSFKLIGDGDTKELIGSKGNDTLTAGSSGTSLWGGKGNDVLIGDVGADEFIFRAGDGSDTIQGFDSLDELKIYDKRGKTSTYSKAVFSGNTLTLSIKGGGKVIFENVSASDSFKINGTPHQISGKKLI